MTSQPSVVFHLGPHKTATTHIQRSFLHNKTQIAATNVRTYGPEFLRARHQSIDAIFGVGSKRSKDPAALASTLLGAGGRIVFSEENYIGGLHNRSDRVHLPVYVGAPRRIRELVEAIRDRPVEVFLAVRSPWSFLTSAYSQLLIAGSRISPAAFKETHDVLALDWVELYARIAEIPDLGRFVVWRYEDYQTLWPRLMAEMLGAKAATGLAPYPHRPNPGMSQRAVKEILTTYADHPKRISGAKLRSEYPIDAANPKFELYDKSEQAVADAAYAAQVEHLTRTPGITFLTPERLLAGGADRQG